MTNPQQVIDESRPMLEEFLCDIGLHREGARLELRTGGKSLSIGKGVAVSAKPTTAIASL